MSLFHLKKENELTYRGGGRARRDDREGAGVDACNRAGIQWGGDGAVCVRDGTWVLACNCGKEGSGQLPGLHSLHDNTVSYKSYFGVNVQN